MEESKNNEKQKIDVYSEIDQINCNIKLLNSLNKNHAKSKECEEFEDKMKSISFHEKLREHKKKWGF